LLFFFAVLLPFVVNKDYQKAHQNVVSRIDHTSCRRRPKFYLCRFPYIADQMLQFSRTFNRVAVIARVMSLQMFSIILYEHRKTLRAGALDSQQWLWLSKSVIV